MPRRWPPRQRRTGPATRTHACLTASRTRSATSPPRSRTQPAGGTLPWAVRRLADGQVVGSTRFLDMEVFVSPPPWPPGVARGTEPADVRPPSVLEIGSTWYSASAQRTAVNTEVKLLQMTHAFEDWQVLRTTFKTDARNHASRRATERLGARPEGVRRAHAVASDGTVRDSAYYSLLRQEWPQARDHLNARLAGLPTTYGAGGT